MGTRNQPGKFDCYKAAANDEPMFVLLARDMCAPVVIETWCTYRAMLVWLNIKPITDLEMIAEARQCARDMTEWKKSNAR